MSPTERPDRILVVDDDEATSFILRKRLEHAGYEVILANSVDGAFEVLEQKKPDLVLSDVMMPGTSGYDLCRRMRETGALRDIPVILVSARDQVDAIVEGLDAGADDYLAKPFNPDELLARVRSQLRIKDLQEQLLAAEQMRVAGELAGAAAHEINQPLTILMGYAEMLLPLVEGDSEVSEKVRKILESAGEIAAAVKKIQQLRGYKTRPYMESSRIIDLHAGTDGEGEE
jgi:CheY-like chemotaxis protein